MGAITPMLSAHAQTATSLDFLIARAISRDNPVECFDAQLIAALAEALAENRLEIIEDAKLKLKLHYTKSFNVVAWNKKISIVRNEIMQARAAANRQEAAEEQATRAEAIPASKMDREYILNRLQQIVERCMQGEPVLDRQGNPTGQYTFQAMSALRALELGGKEIGMFVDRSKVEMSVKDALERGSTEEIASMLEDMEKRRTVAMAAQRAAEASSEAPAEPVQ
jgi:hypothetical protein